MARVLWSREARRVLTDVRDYIAESSPTRADEVVTGIIESTARLATFPLSGRIVREAEGTELREVIRGRYRVVYRIEDQNVSVVAIWHGAMDVRSRLADYAEDA